MNWSDYSYASDGSIMMVLLIIILGVLVTYLLLDKNTRTNKWSDKQESWNGEDIKPEYMEKFCREKNVDLEGIRYTPSLDNPFNDPEVPNRTKKPKRKKKKTVTPRKRGYLPVVKKQKKRKKVKKT